MAPPKSRSSTLRSFKSTVPNSAGPDSTRPQSVSSSGLDSQISHLESGSTFTSALESAPQKSLSFPELDLKDTFPRSSASPELRPKDASLNTCPSHRGDYPSPFQCPQLVNINLVSAGPPIELAPAHFDQQLALQYFEKGYIDVRVGHVIADGPKSKVCLLLVVLQ